MVSSRSVCRLSAFALLVLAGLSLFAAGSCATPERTGTAASALDGPEEVWAPRQKLLCNDTLPYSYFGWSAAIDVDQAIVGAYRADHDRGAAYVFTWNGKKWVQQAKLKLTANEGAPSDFLGGSVALAGDTAVVGAPYKSIAAAASGAAYVFDRSEGQWAQTAKLTVKDASTGSSFGWSTAFTLDTIVVGSLPNDFNGQITPVPLEAVYVFGRSGGTWTQVAKLKASDATAGQLFGASVAMEGDTLVVGAPGDSGKVSGSGAAYVFARSGGAWAEIAKLKASDAKLNDAMGWSTAISAGTVVAGAPHSNAPKLSSGAAYVFTQGPGGFTQQAKLLPHDPTAYYRVGGSVAIDGDTVLLGRQFYYTQDQDHGAAYVFVRSGDVWTETAKFVKDADPVGIWFGNSVAVRGTTAFVGSVEYDVAGIDDPGATFVFALRRVNSVACSDGAECVSGFCADGVCCDAACDGACMACSAAKKGGGDDGVCEPTLDGTDPDGDCAPYTCSGGACLSSCQSAADCAKAFYCDPARRECATVPHDIGATAGCSVSPRLHGGGSLGLVAGLCAAMFWARRRRSPRLPRGLSALLFGLLPVACGGDPSVDGRGPGAAQHPAQAPEGSVGIQIEEQTELFAGGPQAGDQFGGALALSGDTAIIGAPLKDAPNKSDAGAAYVFTRTDDVWTQEAMLVPMDPAVNAQLGGSVALSGDTVVVSAPPLYAAYVFTRSAGAFTQQAKLTMGSAFSGAVAVSGDTLALGAIGDSDLGGNAGAAYVFLRAGDAWNQEIKLLASDGAEDDRFGAAVAADGDRVVVGARHADEQDTDAGAAYVFVRADSGWIQEAKLLASDGALNDNLGGVIALSGERVVLGVPAAAMGTGAAYVFARDAGGVWSEEAKLTASDGAAGDAFGASVTIDGDTVVVGAPGSDVRGADAGAAYVYMRVNGAWLEEAEITAEDAQPGDHYGAAAAASGTTAIVGAPLNDLALTGMDVGAAYALLLGSPAGCIDDTHSAAERLPGEPLVVTDCAPRRCDLSTGTCRTGCKETAECDDGFFCDPAKKDCARPPAKDIGAKGGCRTAAGEAPSLALPLLLVALSSGVLMSRRRRKTNRSRA